MYVNLLLVGAGGAAGSMLRYGCQRWLNAGFPTGTLLVNLLGCLLIGLLSGWLAGPGKELQRLLLVTGFCGGFTTFSAFTADGISLLQQGRWLSFAFYSGISVAGGLAATFIGFKLTN